MKRPFENPTDEEIIRLCNESVTLRPFSFRGFRILLKPSPDVAVPCSACAMREEKYSLRHDGAQCPYLFACFSKTRKDHQSIIFAKYKKHNDN